MKIELLKDLIYKCIKDSNTQTAGFYELDVFRMSIEKLTKKGIECKNHQTVRQIVSSIDSTDYILSLVQLIDNNEVWCVWKIDYIDGKRKYRWQGHCYHLSIKERKDSI